MDLPIRFSTEPKPELQISVDGAWGQPGLNLSHWPGNATPPDLKRDLSTEIVFAFDKLPLARRLELARGCTAIANNHYDTDGLCAAFATRFPDRALAIEAQLVDVARAGDFFEMPNERSYQIDLVLNGLVDAERSPWSARFAGASDHDRREIVMRDAVMELDDIVTGDLERFEDLWRAELERSRLDRALLSAGGRDDIAHLDLCVFTSGAPRFDPGRHAMFGATAADRVLAIGERASGATYRLVIGTHSFFDIVSRPPLARPALESLVARLNTRENIAENAPVRWHHQPQLTPSPELWFGRAHKGLFSEHAPYLEASHLAPAVVRREIIDALRAAWTFPEAD